MTNSQRFHRIKNNAQKVLQSQIDLEYSSKPIPFVHGANCRANKFTSCFVESIRIHVL